MQQRRRDSGSRARAPVHRRFADQPEREGALGHQQTQPSGAVPTTAAQPAISAPEQQATTAAQNGTILNHFVTFYFTNVPDDISYRSLRQGFEVCDIMEDIYLAKKCNVNGDVFGFVRYSKVKDLEKLLKAVNNIWFGDCKVVAKVFAYDRYGQKRGEGRVRGEGEKSIEGEKRKNEEVIYVEGEKRNMVGLNLEMQGEGIVHGAKPVMGERTVVVEREQAIGGSAIRHNMISKQVFVPKYSSSVNDLSWANKGVVVSVVNGEVIPVIQQRIFDVGFDKLVIIPLGAYKVFLRSLDDSDVSILFSQAPEFFDNFFSRLVRWSKDVLIRERGAWVRIYGVLLHAWNYDFFKLCVMDCGRLLKIDDITLERDRFDYARILLSTTSLEVINTEAQIMVDGGVIRSPGY